MKIAETLETVHTHTHTHTHTHKHFIKTQKIRFSKYIKKLIKIIKTISRIGCVILAKNIYVWPIHFITKICNQKYLQIIKDNK